MKHLVVFLMILVSLSLSAQVKINSIDSLPDKQKAYGVRLLPSVVPQFYGLTPKPPTASISNFLELAFWLYWIRKNFPTRPCSTRKVAGCSFQAQRQKPYTRGCSSRALAPLRLFQTVLWSVAWAVWVNWWMVWPSRGFRINTPKPTAFALL